MAAIAPGTPRRRRAIRTGFVTVTVDRMWTRTIALIITFVIVYWALTSLSGSSRVLSALGYECVPCWRLGLSTTEKLNCGGGEFS